jgi:hypothetical protein
MNKLSVRGELVEPQDKVYTESINDYRPLRPFCRSTSSRLTAYPQGASPMGRLLQPQGVSTLKRLLKQLGLIRKRIIRMRKLID